MQLFWVSASDHFY